MISMRDDNFTWESFYDGHFDTSLDNKIFYIIGGYLIMEGFFLEKNEGL